MNVKQQKVEIKSTIFKFMAQSFDNGSHALLPCVLKPQAQKQHSSSKHPLLETHAKADKLMAVADFVLSFERGQGLNFGNNTMPRFITRILSSLFQLVMSCSSSQIYVRKIPGHLITPSPPPPQGILCWCSYIKEDGGEQD